MKFRNDISFLRAVSVISVLLYHFKFSFFKGGFIGVDIFFVISGYLMTRIILSEFKTNTFTYWNYLKKRINRILPALLVMITFFAPVIYFLIPTQFLIYMRSFFSSSLFFSNIYYYLNSGYFNNKSQFNYLLHTWSLSVEWQFYLIYPIILLFLRPIFLNRRNAFNLFFIVIMVLSFSSMLYHNQSYSFYMFYTRAWEMMFGGLAYLFAGISKRISERNKNILVIASLLLILASIFLINSHEVLWPSPLTIVPVISTAAILILNVDWKIFENKIISFFGNISYSLYLWHWPFYVLSVFFSINDRFRHKLLFIGISLIFSTISYYIIEKKNYNKKTFTIILSSIILFAISFSFSKIKENSIFDDKTAKLVWATSNYKSSNDAINQYGFNENYFKSTDNFKNYNLNKINIEPEKKYIILLGDSHAGMFFETLKDIVKDSGYELMQINAEGTYPMIYGVSDFSGPKEFFNYFYKIYFPENKNNIDLVIISSNYSAYEQSDLENKIDFTEKYFKKQKTKTLYLGQTPTYYIDYPTQYYINQQYGIVHRNQFFADRNVNSANSYLKKRLGSRYIELLNYNVNKVSEDGTPFVYDTNHLTQYGANQYKNNISKALK
ncbi:acyltransferase family protein [Chryseobacterium joostei]|nr:acyltransferase family protein [Chryseobacterium joostei]